MTSWIAAFIICAAIGVPTFILIRRRAPKWVIRAIWVVWGAIWFVVAGLLLYGVQPVSIAVMLVCGIIVGLVGGMIAIPPFARTQRLPGRYEGGERTRWRRYLH
ncbi:MAG TPA: hypothetical protein VKQ30_00835 [Ktedonobacterales bacterium]|nr:hypothetical protein [Ktedonobacterales bacterium]